SPVSWSADQSTPSPGGVAVPVLAGVVLGIGVSVATRVLVPVGGTEVGVSVDVFCGGKISIPLISGISTCWVKSMFNCPSVTGTVKVFMRAMFAPPAWLYTSKEGRTVLP